MARGRLFEYAAIFHPKAKEKKVEGETPETGKSILIVDVTRVLAGSDTEVGMLAARAIPQKYTDKLDQVEIIVRPF